MAKLTREIRPVWPDKEIFKLYLSLLRGASLTESQWTELRNLSVADVAIWITEYGLAPLTVKRVRQAWPALAQLLMADTFSVSAENSLHLRSIESVLTELAKQDIVPGLLKGIVVAPDAWGDLGLRPMSDVDLWLPDAALREATRIIQQLGYVPALKQDRPVALQQLAEGEVEFAHPEWTQGGLDLHWSPFHGWWFQWATNVSTQAAWERKQPFMLGEHKAYRLDNVDQVIHLAVHLAVNEQFSPHIVLRSLFDIVFSLRKWPFEWDELVRRAKEWQIETVIWVVFDLLRQLGLVDGNDELLRALQPGVFSRFIIGRIVSVDSVMTGSNIQFSRWRLLLMLALTDNWKNVARYFGRIVWPDQQWLSARYGQKASRRQHFLQLLKSPTG